jgi:hypothetical protein
MAKDPAFLFYPGDYLRDTQCLSERAQVAYDRLMCEHMRNICITQSQLDFFTKRLTADEKSEVLMVLTKISGGFQISWVADSIEKRREYSESRRKNRTPKEKKKGERQQKQGSTYVPHMENESESVIENESTDEILKEYIGWSEQIVDNNDAQFQTMIYNERWKIVPEIFVILVNDHVGLLHRYPKMRPPTQHAFRMSLIKHIRENKDKYNGKPITGAKQTKQQQSDTTADYLKQHYGNKINGQ